MNNQMNLENVMLLVGNAVERCYNENPKMDFSIFEDIHYELCILWQLECKENENFMEDASQERDEAFYERFGHLGSI